MNSLTHLRSRSEEAGPEVAGRRGAEYGGVGNTSSCALMTDRLVRGDHGSCQLKAAVVTVVLPQRQRVVLLCRENDRNIFCIRTLNHDQYVGGIFPDKQSQ